MIKGQASVPAPCYYVYYYRRTHYWRYRVERNDAVFARQCADDVAEQGNGCPPLKMVEGMRWRWLSVASSMRDMCGTASPMKAMGPQKAVAEAVRSPVTTSSWLRRRMVFTPRFSAYCSPKSSVLSRIL